MSSITPDEQQAAAIVSITEWLRQPVDFNDVSTRLKTISGPGGSGKTTLLGMLIHLTDGAIVSAPTNKACRSLHRRGFKNATTVDKVLNKSIYNPILTPVTDADLEYWAEEGIEPPASGMRVWPNWDKIDRDGPVPDLCITDESSMLTQAQCDRLLGMFKKVLLVGDGYQLPPPGVDEDGHQLPGFFQNLSHDIELTQMHRTGEGSAITLLANTVRARKPWMRQEWGDGVTILGDWNYPDVMPQTEAALRDCDIMFAFKNETCNRFNPLIRNLRGLDTQGTMPMRGDVLLSWVEDKEIIFKSELYRVHSSSQRPGAYVVNMKDEDDRTALVSVNKATLQDQQSDKHVPNASKFSFGHCITGHKSQSGEWNKVVVMASDKSKRHADYWNWLYTVFSRARQHLTILL